MIEIDKSILIFFSLQRRKLDTLLFLPTKVVMCCNLIICGLLVLLPKSCHAPSVFWHQQAVS